MAHAEFLLPKNLAVVLSGGGARGAYQAGVLRGIARHLPGLRFPIICGVSAGGINTVFLAAHPGPLGEAARDLAEVWRRLEISDVFRVDTPSLVRHFARWITRLSTGGSALAPEVRGFVDARPLHTLIENTVATVDGEFVGIAENLERGLLHAVALTTLNYTTGQTVTWVQGAHIEPWRRPRRRSVNTRLSVDHVMASASLPLFFPAVRLGDAWHGDGGVRMDAPLSPPIHLGATRILAISPRYEMSDEEADRHKISGYPPPAQILSHLMNSIFLDVIDRDARVLAMLNRLATQLPPEQRLGLRPVDILVLRPSEDLGRLAADYEARLPQAFRYLTRSLGTRETTTPDFLSIVLFQPDYLAYLLEVGERDAEARIDDIRRLVFDSTA
ncbi:MAG TPA: patatin-like phospholipase family protein [Thermoanaerobaculia bacterium]|nr:patatin-like phospholipase family protein [Thermoanaerobaculia bacterium]